jgi:hypothetical protein
MWNSLLIHKRGEIYMTYINVNEFFSNAKYECERNPSYNMKISTHMLKGK